MTPITLLVVGLLVAGVAANRVPPVPAPVLSLAGVYLYWWDTGFTEPGLLTLAALTLAGGLALSGSVIRSTVVSRVGGVSPRFAAIGSTVGGVLYIFWDTPGLLIGLMGTVFVLEYLRGRDALGSMKAALVVALGRLADRLMTVLLTVAILLAMLVVILI